MFYAKLCLALALLATLTGPVLADSRRVFDKSPVSTAVVPEKPANAYDSVYNEMVHMGRPQGSCIDAGPMFMQITGKEEDKVYNVESYHEGALVMRGYLETNKTTFGGTGPIRQALRVQYLTTKEFPTQDGFSAKFMFWRECK